MADALKQLKIKTGVLNRNVKDLAFARSQLDREVTRLRGFEAAEDTDKVHQQKKVIQEHEATVPTALTRIQRAIDDLEEFLAANSDAVKAATAGDDAPMTAATAALADGRKALGSEEGATAAADGGAQPTAAPAAAAAGDDDEIEEYE